MIYLLLRGLAALAALLLALSLLFGLFGSRRRWRLWIGLGILLVVFVAASEAVTPAAPFQHGPYHGRRRTGCESLGAPASAVAIGRGRRLEAFERRPGEPGPTVRLVARGGRVKWCIHATVEDRQVQSLRFDRTHTTLVGGTVVVGRVQWTYGNEAAWWYLDPFGGLRAYFFSS
ncbi:MAG: hypothetical protein ACJ8GN_23850 [Longimicrobiaceae bacterium]